MKKAKKLGLQSLALVLMAFVLVAGVAFGMTGAWFQSNDSKADQTITMGHAVNITLDKVASTGEYGITNETREGVLTAAMPGDTLKYSGLKVVVPANQSAMYVIIKVDNTTDNSTLFGFNIENGWTPFTGTGLTDYAFRTVAASATAQNLVIYDEQTFELSTELTNDVADDTITISAAAWAIQQANVTIAATTTLTQLNAILAQHGTDAYVLA